MTDPTPPVFEAALEADYQTAVRRAIDSFERTAAANYRLAECVERIATDLIHREALYVSLEPMDLEPEDSDETAVRLN